MTVPDQTAIEHPPHWVVLQLIEGVRDASWAPEPAAERLLAQAADAHSLHRLRASLRALAGAGDPVGRARALTTLNLAISRMEDSNASSAGGSHHRGDADNDP